MKYFFVEYTDGSSETLGINDGLPTDYRKDVSVYKEIPENLWLKEVKLVNGDVLLDTIKEADKIAQEQAKRDAEIAQQLDRDAAIVRLRESQDKDIIDILTILNIKP